MGPSLESRIARILVHFKEGTEFNYNYKLEIKEVSEEFQKNETHKCCSLVIMANVLD